MKRKIISFFLLFGILGVIGWFGSQVWLFSREMNVLRVYWRDSGIKLSANTDGPFVVTHLTGTVTINGAGFKAVAALPQLLAIVDSHGAFISKSELDALIWLDTHGLKIARPKEGSFITALYYRPNKADYRE